MTWLRIDDGFSRHPKVTALNHRDRWAWVDILCYCARYKTGGFLPENIREHVPGASDRLLEQCVALELVDETEDGLRIHDWEEYAPRDPTGADRQAKWRKKNRNANRNGARNADVTENVTAESVTEPLPRAQARARPRPVLTSINSVAVTSYDANGNGGHPSKRLIDEQLGEAAG